MRVREYCTADIAKILKGYIVERKYIPAILFGNSTTVRLCSSQIEFQQEKQEQINPEPSFSPFQIISSGKDCLGEKVFERHFR